MMQFEGHPVRTITEFMGFAENYKADFIDAVHLVLDSPDHCLIQDGDAVYAVESDVSAAEHFTELLETLLSTRHPGGVPLIIGYLASVAIVAGITDAKPAINHELFTFIFQEGWKGAFASDDDYETWLHHQQLPGRTQVILDLEGFSVRHPADKIRYYGIRGPDKLTTIPLPESTPQAALNLGYCDFFLGCGETGHSRIMRHGFIITLAAPQMADQEIAAAANQPTPEDPDGTDTLSINEKTYHFRTSLPQGMSATIYRFVGPFPEDLVMNNGRVHG